MARPLSLKTARGRQLFYQRRPWRVFRVQYLSPDDLDLGHGWCPECRKRGRVRPAVDLHHVMALAVRPDLALDEGNVQGLCKPCHARATGRERGG